MIFITLTQLEYLSAVARHGHFGRAARACHVSQPTLSMQVHKLEEQLGALVFDRSCQPIRATPLGRRIVEQARAALKEAARIEELVTEERETLAGNFRLGIIPTLSPYLLPLFLKDFVDQYPGVNLKVEEAQTSVLLEKLKDDRLDAGLMATPVNRPGIVERPLFLEPFVVYLHPGHPLAKLKTVPEKELDREDIWLLNEGHCFREQALLICGQAGRARERGIEFESGNLETLKRLVDQNFGYTLVPELSTLGMNAKDKMKCLRPFKTPGPKREVSLVFTRHFVRERLLNALAGVIQSRLPRELARPEKNPRIVPIPSLG